MTRRVYKNFIFNDDKNMDKRFHEEMTAKLCLKSQSRYTSKTGPSELNEMYEETEALPERVMKECKLILDSVDSMAAAMGPLKKKLSKGQLMNLFDFVQICDEEGFKIRYPKKMFQFFMDADTLFIDKSKKVLEEDQKDKSYTYWTRSNGQPPNYGKIRYLLREHLKINSSSLCAEKILAPKRTSSDSFSFKDKLELYTLQDARDRKGANISILDVYMGKYEADHVQSVADGGTTTIQNGELMPMKQNRAKGAQSNDPVFPHQKSRVPTTAFKKEQA